MISRFVPALLLSFDPWSLPEAGGFTNSRRRPVSPYSYGRAPPVVFFPPHPFAFLIPLFFFRRDEQVCLFTEVDSKPVFPLFPLRCLNVLFPLFFLAPFPSPLICEPLSLVSVLYRRRMVAVPYRARSSLTLFSLSLAVLSPPSLPPLLSLCFFVGVLD